MPKTYTVKDVATILGFSTNSIYAFLKEKRIKGVRVGKGRFRIPEEELARILHLSKKPMVSPPPSELNIPLQKINAEPTVVLRSDQTDVLTADLFDWFIGIVSVVSGLGLFLFNTPAHIEPLNQFLSFLRVVWICVGVGVLASSVYGKSRGWKILFQSILVLTVWTGAYGLARVFDVAGAVLYGSFGIVIVARMLKRISSQVSMGIFMTVLGYGMVLGMALWSQQPLMKSLASLFQISPSLILWMTLCVVTLNLSLYWLGYIRRMQWLFVISCGVLGICCIVTAGLYSNFLYWSRAFFYITLSFFCLFLPIFQLLEPNKSGRQRVYLHLFFACIGGFLILAVLTILTVHQALWHQRINDFQNKIIVGKTFIEGVLVNVTSSVVTASANTDVLINVEKHDAVASVRNAKIVYEGNPLIRRLTFLDAIGDVVAIYPYGVLEYTNYAFRDYFVHVRDTKEVYVSNVFDTNVNQIHKPAVSVTAPFLDTKGIFRGVTVASMNLEKIALQLQQLARESGGEYFTVSDANGKYIIHSNSALVGTSVPSSDPIHKGVEHKHGIEEMILPDGTLGLVAYDSIPSLGWGISIQVPSGSVLALSSYSLALTFGTLFGVFVFSILLLYLMKFRWLPQQRGSP